MTPIRYMGTKRHIAPRVRRLVADIKPRGRVLDLFSGMGCVTEGLAGLRSVVTNDALAFTGVLARARFTGSERTLTAGEVIARLRDPFRSHADMLAGRYRHLLRDEQRALDIGHLALAAYMREASHVANSERVALQARRAARQLGPERYKLATLYFAAGYFSLRQAIHLDALRFAIDTLTDIGGHERDWMLSAWLAAGAVVTNAPGHTAQHLKPNTKGASQRIARYWRRRIWTEFQSKLSDLNLVGTKSWRQKNRSEISDALHLLTRGDIENIGAVYADPPYTKDQYSRYYHVYETLYRYDFPDSHGEGRTPSKRFSTDFCLKTAVIDAFSRLFDGVAQMGVPLILSYPKSGLLADAGSSVKKIASGRMIIRRTETVHAAHSTLGASQGSKTKAATEKIYVCVPI